MWNVFLLVSCVPTGHPDVELAPLRTRAQTPRVLLTVTDPEAAGGFGTVDVRIRGLPDLPHTVVIGNQDGESIHDGITFTVDGTDVFTVTTDADGWGDIVDIAPAAGFVADTEIAFQAGVIDPADSTQLLSREQVGTVVEEVQEPPLFNVLVILADDMGVDRLVRYDTADTPDYLAQTPEINALADAGLLFKNFWALPVCGPTRSALQTGRLPRRTGWGQNPDIAFDNAVTTDVELDQGFITIAELAKLSPWAEYSTSYVGKWQLSTPYTPSGAVTGIHEQGWDWYNGTIIGVMSWFGTTPLATDPTRSYVNWGMFDDAGTYAAKTQYATARQADDAVARIAAMPEPWIMQVSFNAPHSPFHQPPNPAAGGCMTVPVQSGNNKRHRLAIASMDCEIGVVLDALEVVDGGGQKLRDRTVVIFTTDNGSPGQSAGAAEVGSTMKDSIHEGGIRVPFIVDAPDGVTGTTTALAHVTDIFPTIAEIVGVHIDGLPGNLDPAEPLVVDGESLVDVLDGSDPDGRRDFVYSERFCPTGITPTGADATDYDERAIRDADYKLERDVLSDVDTFYDYDADGTAVLVADPVGAGLQDELDALKAEMDSMVADMELGYDSTNFPDPNDPACNQ